MSVPPQQKATVDKSVKQRAAMQHAGEVYYGTGLPAHEATGRVAPEGPSMGHPSIAFNPEKRPQNQGPYQQAAPGKWVHQDTAPAPGWSQEIPWSQNFGPYLGGINNVRGQVGLVKTGHEGGAMHPCEEKQAAGGGEAYVDSAQARELEWEQHTTAMRYAHLQALQQGEKAVDVQGQPHAMTGSMLQPFQVAFGATKQHLPSGYYQLYNKKPMGNVSYSEQPKSQHELLQLQQQIQQHQIQQQQQHQIHQQQQRQQQHQLQQQMQQHHLQQQQQQQLHLMQQHYHQQQVHEQRQHMLQLQQQAPHGMLQQEMQQQSQHFRGHPSEATLRELPPTLSVPGPPPEHIPCPAPTLDLVEKVKPDHQEATQVLPRRSRRLSREGLSPSAAVPSTVPWNQTGKEPPMPQNGAMARGEEAKADEAQAQPSLGVIQSTNRRRRASKEINLETLAQKASEMESLPSKVAKEDSLGRQSMLPLVIPVSVPVHRGQHQPEATVGWQHGPAGPHDPVQPEHKASVIVARRRSLRNPLFESAGQDADDSPERDDDSKGSKLRRRPRPEPLFIPPPKPGTFIVPSVYSSITPYQSHLRSPVRPPEHPLLLPPYTPPPILSPVREGSGLYFSTFLSSIAAGNQGLPPPPATPKSATRSLLRSTSADITPPILPLMGEATPVSLEPRINIGSRYQAEVPELRDRLRSSEDQLHADVVWVPLKDSEPSQGEDDIADDLMNLACSSALCGGGTNQELALHCLHESRGDVLEALTLLLLKEPIFARGHPLADYHYSGSDRWTLAEKRYFNKGISTYTKDFFMVQKVVQSKTVAQCVEFYYTNKKQVKIGRNGTFTYGPQDSPEGRGSEMEVNLKSTPASDQWEKDHSMKWEGSCDRGQDGGHIGVTQTFQAFDKAGVVLAQKNQEEMPQEKQPAPLPPPSAPRKPRPDPPGKKSRASAPTKGTQEPEGVFPCKKCSRVFYKVKSRSAHMKSHAEQEKKAAALRLKEEEEERVAVLAREEEARRAEEADLNGTQERGETSSAEEGGDTDMEDEEDKDWR